MDFSIADLVFMTDMEPIKIEEHNRSSMSIPNIFQPRVIRSFFTVNVPPNPLRKAEWPWF
jgi:predicted acylesterase/phospholipase RssA